VSDAPVVVTISASDMEAELACGLLRSEGIKCGHRPTNVAAGAGDGLTGIGPHEVMVAPADVERARELLAEPAS
jgi:hypothetical protein